MAELAKETQVELKYKTNFYPDEDLNQDFLVENPSCKPQD